ncbi:hypothetical protein lerEdw1_018514 [Lerista edwardsae]|nr:hypothetical protein lerEdw1_018514 [Lerista edwardsae]
MATKRLARQLGIIRSSSKTSLSGQRQNRPKLRQLFDYLIVIDFESTCWNDGRKHYKQEISKWRCLLCSVENEPLSLLNLMCSFLSRIKWMKESLSTYACLSFLSGFKRYKMRRKLFSIQLLPAVLLLKENYALLLHGQVIPTTCAKLTVASYLKDFKVKVEKTVGDGETHLTILGIKRAYFFTDWDLGVCLQYECKRKQLRKPDILNSWIDLRATYKVRVTSQLRNVTKH